ncbi:MAG: flavodoxin domain-containing protein [Rhodocyclaceae bacterium]
MSSSHTLTLWVASHDGRSAQIAERMATYFEAHGLATCTHALTDAPPPVPAGPVLVVAAVRYGHLLPGARAALRHLNQARHGPLALAVVCLSARRPDRRSARDNPYLRHAIARHGVTPILAEAFGGRLDYARCRWLDRQMIRLIMKLTGGPSDGVATLDCTDWAQVEHFAARLTAMLATDTH